MPAPGYACDSDSHSREMVDLLEGNESAGRMLIELSCPQCNGCQLSEEPISLHMFHSLARRWLWSSPRILSWSCD